MKVLFYKALSALYTTNIRARRTPPITTHEPPSRDVDGFRVQGAAMLLRVPCGFRGLIHSISNWGFGLYDNKPTL